MRQTENRPQNETFSDPLAVALVTSDKPVEKPSPGAFESHERTLFSCDECDLVGGGPSEDAVELAAKHEEQTGHRIELTPTVARAWEMAARLAKDAGLPPITVKESWYKPKAEGQA